MKRKNILVFPPPQGRNPATRGQSSGRSILTKEVNNQASNHEQGRNVVIPDRLQVVPHPRSRPLANVRPIGNILTIILAHLTIFAVALYGRLNKDAQSSRLLPHHILVIAAVGLMVAAPVFETHYDGADQLVVESSFLPIVVYAQAKGHEETWTLAPFSSQETGLTGPLDVTIAPAFPGMKMLVPSGPLVAYAPLSLALVAMAWGFRHIGA